MVRPRRWGPPSRGEIRAAGVQRPDPALQLGRGTLGHEAAKGLQAGRVDVRLFEQRMRQGSQKQTRAPDQ